MEPFNLQSPIFSFILAVNLKQGEPIEGLAKEMLSRAGGDKYGNKTPLTESSTRKEEPVNIPDGMVAGHVTTPGHGNEQSYYNL